MEHGVEGFLGIEYLPVRGMLVYWLTPNTDVISKRELIGKTINNSIKKYFNYWKKSYVKPSNGNTKGGGFYVEAPSTGWHAYPAKTNSEAHGFGMIIMALMGEKEYFDGFYNMYDKHRSTINRNNMSWVITVKEYNLSCFINCYI